MVEYFVQLDHQLLLWINGFHTPFLDGIVPIFTHAATWIPMYVALFWLVIKSNQTVTQIATIVACAGLCVLLTGTLDDMFVKPMVARLRPTHNPTIGILVNTVDGYRGGLYGFFSAHAANTFSIAVFFCLLVRSRLMSCMLVGWSLLNCYTRLYLGVHYPFDILVGLLWGGCMGWLIYVLYVRSGICPPLNKRFVSSQFTDTGYRLSDVRVVITVFTFTCFYAMYRALIS